MIPPGFRPMKGESVDLESVRYPVFVSPKEDGHRCVTFPGDGALASSLEQIRNRHICEKLFPYHYLDGELIVSGDFGSITSAVSRHDGQPDFAFRVFDHTEYPNDPFYERLDRLRSIEFPSFISVIPQYLVHDENSLSCIMDRLRPDFPEGVILRDPNGPYKYGRSTVNQGYALKMKYLKEIEVTVTGCVERFANMNRPSLNKLGLTKRSLSQLNKIPTDMLGALVVKSDLFDDEFNVGTGIGWTDDWRRAVWKIREQLPGRQLTIRYQDVGTKNKPRQPIGIRFREGWDTTSY